MNGVVEQGGRVAIREEGPFVNVYYAMPNTMEGALLLFSVNSNAARYPGVRDQIIAFGRQIVGEAIFESSGVRPLWPDPPSPAPEHERSGHA